MAENQLKKSDEILEEELLDAIVTTPYKYGFTTDVETEKFEKGLSEEIVKKISLKKEEPDFLLKFREKAYKAWKKMNSPNWAYLGIPEIDYESVDQMLGYNITIITSAKTPKESFELLNKMGLPFRK